MGGKRQLLPNLLSLIPSKLIIILSRLLVVVHCFLTRLKKAVINDNNGELVLAYQVIKTDVELLIDELEKHKENNSKEYYFGISMSS